MDLVRNVQDPQQASKSLVEHALARFSTDNLSCMIVRFDGKAVQEAVQNKSEPIGVEGDPSSKGALSEAEHLVLDAKKKLDESGETQLDRIPTDMVEEQQAAEPGPELNPAALEAARKDKRNIDTTPDPNS